MVVDIYNIMDDRIQPSFPAISHIYQDLPSQDKFALAPSEADVSGPIEVILGSLETFVVRSDESVQGHIASEYLFLLQNILYLRTCVTRNL
jgi:hypothetical protein